MNFIERFFEILNKYNTVGRDCEDVVEAIDKINKGKVEKQDNADKNAVLVLGYSGNGKTTYVKKFMKANPDYCSINYDDILQYVSKLVGDKVTMSQLYTVLAKVIVDCYQSGQNMIFDANFLNICNRMSLCDFLHELGYNVNIVDVTPQFKDTIVHRIEDEARSLLEKGVSSSYWECYSLAQKRILSYYEYEKVKTCFAEQLEFSAQYLGADYVFGLDDDLRRVGKLPTETK